MDVTKIIEWDMGHRVPNHKNKCRHPHGHRYRLEVSMRGAINQEKGSSSEGMVLDFGDIKELMRIHIHDRLDHCFMIYAEDSLLAPFAKEHADDLMYVLVPFIPTVENIAIWCYEQLTPHVPKGLIISHIRLYETPNSWADFSPM
ncbi:MAG: 6-pyruvoyl tetrahydropterin synthase family protein [Oligoflexales bacterium]